MKPFARDLLPGLLQDVRSGSRVFRREPGFSAVVVVILALGIGASTAVFSVADHVLLRDLPYAQPDRLVRVYETMPQNPSANVNPLNLLDWRRESAGFEEIAGYTIGDVALNEGEPGLVLAGRVTPNLFRTLRADPLLGRVFSDVEGVPGGEDVVVVSYGLWRSRLGGDAAVTGRSIRIDGAPHTVIGVMPPTFRAPRYTDEAQPDLWLPLRIGSGMGRGGHWLGAVARLRDGVTLAQAQDDLSRTAHALRERHPETNRDVGVRVVPLHRALVGDARTPLLVLLVAVAFLLLAACANVSGLLLARGIARSRELATRAALGAGRLRLARHVLAEGLLLACVGGAAGTLVASWLLALVLGLAPSGPPRLETVSLDLRVLGFALAASLLTGLLAGLVPALRIAGGEHAAVLRSGGSGARAGGRMLGGLVVAQVTAALVLAIGAGLLGRSLWALLDTDPGFDAQEAHAFELRLPGRDYEAGAASRFVDELVQRLRATPGLTAAGAVSILPFGGGYSCDSFEVPERPGIDQGCAESRVATPGYFRALGVPLLRGRDFGEQDARTSPAVAIINQTMAQRLWPGQQAVGRTIVYGEPHTVVGVSADLRHFGLDAPPAPEMYFPLAQMEGVANDMTVVVRAADGSRNVAPLIRSELRTLSPGLAIGDVRSMAVLVADSAAQARFRTVLLALFAALALAITAFGIYGIASFAVRRRIPEIGIRIALGAAPHRLVAMILSQTGRLVLVGTLAGLALSLVLSGLLRTLLYGVTTTDTVTFVAVPLLVCIIGLLASYAPARRAARTSPTVTLRAE